MITWIYLLSAMAVSPPHEIVPMTASPPAPRLICSLDNKAWFPARIDGGCYASDTAFGLEFIGRLANPRCNDEWDLSYANGNFVCVKRGAK